MESHLGRCLALQDRKVDFDLVQPGSDEPVREQAGGSDTYLSGSAEIKVLAIFQ